MPDEGWRGRYGGALIASTYILAVSLVAQKVNDVVDRPYLDEIFHIPQAQQYCRGEYRQYDPKLTTPPGLYGLSILIAYLFLAAGRILPGIQPHKACDTVVNLRLTTLVSVLILPWIIAAYSQSLESRNNNIMSPKDQKGPIKMHLGNSFASPMEALTLAESDPKGAARRARASIAQKDREVRASRRRGAAGIAVRTLDSLTETIDAHSIALLPPMWFFGFLYYTDVPSTVLVLAMLTAANKQRRIQAALLGAASLTLRQTNVVWMLFAIGTSVLDRLGRMGLDGRPLSTTRFTDQLSSLTKLSVFPTLKILISEVLPYIPVFAASAAYLFINGSIVLGDRDNHQVSPHLTQPFYFTVFVLVFAWPTIALRSWQIVARVGISRVAALFITFAFTAILAVKYGTVTHPFLLADNRHYAFYLWRRIIGRTWWSRYALVVVHAFASLLCVSTVALRQSLFWIAGFIICLCAAVIPSPLIEPRYFMIPYIVLRLSLSPKTDKQSPASSNSSSSAFRIACFVEAVWAILINAATVYLFLCKPFKWADSEDWQRFMW